MQSFLYIFKLAFIYNHFEFEEISEKQIKLDTIRMINKQLKILIHSMIEEYRENFCFSKSHLEQLLQLGSYSSGETNIADNGGVPVLKEILRLV